MIESAVVGFSHAIKGQGIYAYIILEKNSISEELLIKEILDTVNVEIGLIAKPDKIQFVSGLPKTRSGKIMKNSKENSGWEFSSDLGDTSTLLDPTVVSSIIENIK